MKMRKIYFMMLLAGALLCVPTGVKAETLTVMDGDYLNQSVPVDGYNMDRDQHNQFLLLTDELSAMNGGNITGMRFYFDRSHEWYNTSKIPDVSIKFAEIDATSLSSLVSVDESFTEVYSGAVNFSFDTKEWSITFDNGYTYNGGNLLIDIQTTAKGAYVKKSGSYFMRFYTKQIEGRVMKGSSTSSNFPKTTFTYEEAAVVGGCNKPKNLTISEELPDGATFTWTQNLDETTYQWACVAKDAEVETWNTLEADIRTKTVTGLTAGTAYDFYVRSYCGEGENEQSDAVKLNFTPVCPAPAYPATPATDLTATTATVTWNAVDGITQYQYVCVEKDATPDWNAATTTTETYASLTGLTASTNYDFHVRSYYSANAISAAVKTTFKTACGAEALPFSEDFSSSIDCWTTQSIAGSTGISSGAFMFSYNSNPPQYLISPELTASAKEVKITFDYYARSASYPETFQVGYSTTTNDVESAFTWGDVVTSTNTTAEKYEQVLPAGVKYVAIKYTADNQWALYIDNFSVAEYEAPACEMPTGLAASEVTANSAKIAWTSEAEAWKLQTSADGENWTDVEGGITNPYTLNGLNDNTKYYVRVCANCGANGDSEWTAAINFTTDCAVKSLPFATEGFESGMPACWSAASQWTIYSYPNDGHDSNTAMRFNASTTADLTLPTIALNDKAQLTFWRRSSSVSCSVYVNDGEGETKLGDFTKSSEWAETTVDLSAYAGKTVSIIIRGNYYGSYKYLYIDDVTVNYAPVAAPTELAVEPADGKATVAWVCAEEGAAFNLQYRAKGADEWTAVTNLTEPTYTIENLTNDTEYEVQIQAVASANRISEWAEAVNFTPVACPEVTGIELTDKTYNSVKVSWTATGNGTWILEYNDGTTFKQVNDLTTTEYVLTSLSTGTTYTIKVKPVCAGGWHQTTTFVPTYTAPASVSVTNATDTGAVASWAAVADAEGYEYIVVVKDAEVNWDNAVAATETSAELKGLNGLTDYGFYVRATYPENGASEYAQAEFATIAYAPANLTAGEITTTTATFTWEANGAATQYQWSTDGENWSEPQTAKEATAENLTAATTYTFSVRACYAEGKYSEPVTQDFTTDCDTFVLPFEENFEKAGALPNCWDAEPQWTMDAYNYYKSAYYSARFNANTANSAELKTPAIRLDKKAELSFFLRNVYGNNTGYVEGKVIAADVENGENQVEAQFIHANNLTEQKLDLSALEGKTVKITFFADGVGTSTNASLYIDDVRVTEITEEPVATGMDNTSAAEQVIKTVENGQIVIILNGVKYNAQGQKL